MENAITKSGIYQIKNTIDGKKYIGSSVNIRKRWNSHKSSLERGDHHSSHLQNAWNKFGKDNFVFEILEEVCKISDLITAEQKYIIQYRASDRISGYNIAPFAGGSCLGVRHTPETIERFKKRKHTQETKNKIGNANRGMKRTTESKNKMRLVALHRPPPTQETREKISRAMLGKIRSCKITKSEVVEIRKKYRSRLKKRGFYSECAREYGVVHSTIWNIVNNVTFKRINE